ncbi:hypothetical protein C8R47DRAFT_259472 [Mycena vitilis]|nr:hypothetical protein C8R47DRAFT_259472 [Mycena vitilis]
MTTLPKPATANLWPLILWIAFRGVDPDRPNLVEQFLDVLRVPNDKNLFVWDNTDEGRLRALFGPEIGSRLLSDNFIPPDWTRCRAEIDSETWSTIEEMTWTENRARCVPVLFVPLMSLGPFNALREEVTVRLAAVSLKFSSTLRMPPNLLVPLQLSFDRFPFDVMARVVDPGYQGAGHSSSSDQTKLDESPCRVVWNTHSSHANLLKRLMCVYLAATTLYNIRTLVPPGKTIVKLFDSLILGLSSLHHGFLESLECYQSDLNTLLAVAKHCQGVTILTVLNHGLCFALIPHTVPLSVLSDIFHDHPQDCGAYTQAYTLRDI